MASHTDHRQTRRAVTQRQNRLILFPALAKQDAGPLVIHRYNVGPFSNWAQMLSLPNNWPLDPSLPTCWHLDIWAPKTTTPLQLLLQTVTDTHKQLARASQVQATNLPELSWTSHSSQATSAIHQLLQLDLRYQSHLHLHTRTCSSHWDRGNLAFQPMVWLQLLAVRHLYTHTRTQPSPRKVSERRQHLEYQVQVWAPQYRWYIDMLKQVQWRTMGMIKELEHLS